MTAAVTWTDPSAGRALLLVDDLIHTESRQRTDKSRLVYGRWGIAVLGNSLLLSMLDPICHFNDKTNRPPLGDVRDLFSLLSSIGSAVLPTKLDWLAKSSMSEESFRRFREAPSGLVVLDCAALELYLLKLRRAEEIITVGSDAWRELAAEAVWQIGDGGARSGASVTADRAAVRDRESSRNVMREWQARSPSTVGGPGASLFVDAGRIDYESSWASVEQAARDSVAGRPLFVYE